MDERETACEAGRDRDAATGDRAPTRRSPTAVEVARRAEVSQSAVSRTFTPGASVSERTRARVLEAADALGYRPNAIARSLISGRSRMIGLLAAYLDNEFYPIVLERLARALQARGYHTLLFIGEPGDRDRQLENLLAYQVDAVVMLSATLSSALARECLGAAIPVVLFNRDVPDTPSSSVTSDNRDGGRQVARLLVRTGHRRIAFLAGDENSSTNRDRESGFVEELAALGRNVHARAVGHYSAERARAATHAFMDAASPPDAIFAANDHMAFSVMDVLRHERGLRVPDDVSVIGFDDVPQAAWAAYDLATVAQPVDELIRNTIELLFARLDHAAAPASVTLPVRLVVRSSVHPGRLAGSRGR